MPSQFGSPAAARVGDPVTHSAALWGLLEGALLGAALGAILVASGGTAAPLLIAGAAATGASLGGAVGKIWGEHHVTPCGRILTGSPNVRINGKPAAFASSLIVCSQHSGPQMVAEGSASVNINGRPAARVGDHGTCGCVIAPPGSPNVFTGGPPVSPLGYAGEVPWYADAALLVLGLAGGGALMAVKGLGAAAIALRLGGSVVGGTAGGAGAHFVGGRMFGEGSTAQTVLTFAGGLVGGGLGYEGGAVGEARLQVALARQRQFAMLNAGRGFNVSPSTWDAYPTIGRNGSYLSDQRAITSVIGEMPSGASSMSISSEQAANLERAMGLERGSLAGGFKVRQVDGIGDMTPRSPLEGNRYFRGPGQHLPGGGPEVVVNSIPTTDGPRVTTIMNVSVH